MFDLGDDIIINSSRIPWLIWIQILIMFLLTLTILLSYFGFFALESSSSSSTHDSLFPPYSPVGSPAFCSHTIQIAGNHDVQREVNTSTGNSARGLLNNAERGGTSLKESTPACDAERFFHPCRYLDLAKQAFLKCLGLGSSSSDKEHEHED